MKYLVSISLLLALSAASFAQSVEGIYERVSLTNVETGSSPEQGNRKGLLLMAYGYYSMMTMNENRRVLGAGERLDTLPDKEKIAYLEEWLDVDAHSGRYEVDGDQLVWHRDVSENPKEVGTVSRLGYALMDDLLVISFKLPNGDRYEWKWRQIR